jgi:hypothetical protein
MKKCTWCGKEYSHDVLRCSVDGQPLSGEAEASEVESASVRSDPIWRPRVLDFLQAEGIFDRVEGYWRPDWKKIREMIEARVAAADRGGAWTEAAMQWAEQLQTDLGGRYNVRCSERFILLSELDPHAAHQLLAFAESTLENIQEALKEAAWRPKLGKHMVFLFTEDDDYYQYVAYFNRDGTHPTSSGCLIHKDYVHIAMPYLDGRNVRRTLTHELTHNCVVHLQLPLWLNEGLAVTFDRAAANWQSPILDHELRDRHLVFWDSENVQSFWAGTSFGEPGESNALSYSLAEIVVHLLLEKQQDFGGFVLHAKWGDGGQTAALDFLETDLGEAMGTFLGDGNWRPNRKAMVECWNTRKRTQEAAQADASAATGTAKETGQPDH